MSMASLLLFIVVVSVSSMRYTIKPFDPARDLQEVNQNQAIDLAASFNHGTIPSDLQADAAGYNKIEEPDSIMGKPSDVFEAEQMRYTRKNYKAPEKPAE